MDLPVSNVESSSSVLATVHNLNMSEILVGFQGISYKPRSSPVHGTLQTEVDRAAVGHADLANYSAA